MQLPLCFQRCGLECNHLGEHNCGLRHICGQHCRSFGARNCLGFCDLEIPHDGIEHRCRSEHLCNVICGSKGCQNHCGLQYGHVGEHTCFSRHISY